MSKSIRELLKKNKQFTVNGSIWIECNGELFFGPGPVELLEIINETGSINQAEKQPAMVYFHPWEIDPQQPQIAASRRSTLRHYTNLSTTEMKIIQLLRDFRFTTITGACHQLRSYNSGDRPGAMVASA